MLSVMPAASRVSGSCHDATVSEPPDFGLVDVPGGPAVLQAASKIPPTTARMGRHAPRV
jgi:hypothetical protein